MAAGSGGGGGGVRARGRNWRAACPMALFGARLDGGELFGVDVFGDFPAPRGFGLEEGIAGGAAETGFGGRPRFFGTAAGAVRGGC